MRRYFGAAAVAAGLVCTACGGGGGGGGGPTSLIPTAAAPGAVLYAKATDIRPVIASAEWTYHSHDYTGPGPGQFRTTATSIIPNGVIEVDSEDPSTQISITADPADGSVTMSVDVSLSPSLPPIKITGYELRSPVRLNEQYVLLDQHLADSGLDVDGDNKADALDIAAWRVVEGQETVALPNGMPGILAVRVDTFFAARFTPSGGGAPQGVTARQSTWYAPGIGVIRNATYSTTPGRTYDMEAWLTGFDGVTHGWGAVVRPVQYVPATMQSTGPAFDAVQMTDGVLAMTSSYVVKIGKDGRIASAIPYSAAGIGGDGGTIKSTTAGLRYVVSSNQNDIRLSRLNNDGTLQAARPVTHLDLAAYNPPSAFVLLHAFTIAPGGDRFWMGWSRSTTVAGNTTDELVVRAFDPDGVPITSEIVLPTVHGIGPTVVMKATPANGLVATWSEYGSNYAAMAQAQIDRDGTVLWSSRQDTGGAPGPCCVFPLFDESSTWLTWRAASMSSADAAHGVRLDSAGQFVGVPTSASAFSTELLAPIDSSFLAGWSNRFTASGGHFHATATVFAAPYPDDSRQFNHLEYAEFDAGSANLAVGMTQARRLVLDGLAAPSLVRPVVFDDRVLLLTDDGSTLKPVLIWR